MTEVELDWATLMDLKVEEAGKTKPSTVAPRNWKRKGDRLFHETSKENAILLTQVLSLAWTLSLQNKYKSI